MANGIIGIDHTLIGVRDLEQARGTYARLGFALTPRGSHIGWGTANYCIMFPQDYIELLGIVDPSKFTNRLDQRLEQRGEGLLGIALAIEDAAATHAALRLCGISSGEPQALARNLELASGTVRPEFTLVHLPEEAAPCLNLILVQHRTPALLRHPDWLEHPNGAIGIVATTAVVEDPVALAPAYERLLGAGCTAITDDTLSVFTGQGAILFVTPNDLAVLYPGIDYPEQAPPYLAAMTIAVRDPRRTAAFLERQGVRFEPGIEGVLRLPPEEACGVLLEFAPPESLRRAAP